MHYILLAIILAGCARPADPEILGPSVFRNWKMPGPSDFRSCVFDKPCKLKFAAYGPDYATEFAQCQLSVTVRGSQSIGTIEYSKTEQLSELSGVSFNYCIDHYDFQGTYDFSVDQNMIYIWGDRWIVIKD